MIVHCRSTKTIRYSLLFSILCVGWLFGASCAQEQAIEVEKTAELLAFLAADEHKGRQAISHEIVTVEEFIAQEFNKAGLKKLPELPGFRHEFSKANPKLTAHAFAGLFKVFVVNDFSGL